MAWYHRSREPVVGFLVPKEAGAGAQKAPLLYRAELEAWLAQEPYVKQRVWQKIDMKPMRLAVLDGKIMP